jgi:hypothetical protein
MSDADKLSNRQPRRKPLGLPLLPGSGQVSLALRESSRVPLETRDIIQRAAKELNYLPGSGGRGKNARSCKLRPVP